MKGKFLLLALAIAAGAPLIAGAAEPAPSSGGPLLNVPETHFDYGYTVQGARIAHVYWLKNIGDDTLRLTDVRPGCGCTKAPLTKKILAPGESTGVDVIFSTGVYSGLVHKSSSIIQESPGPAPPVLSFSAVPTARPDTLQPLVFSPMNVNLDSLKGLVHPQPWSFTIHVTNRSNREVRFHRVSPPIDHITIDGNQWSLGAGQESNFQIALDPVMADSAIAKSVTFVVSDSLGTRYTLPISKLETWVQPKPKSH